MSLPKNRDRPFGVCLLLIFRLSILISALQAFKSRRDDIIIEKVILKCTNPEGVTLFFVLIKSSEHLWWETNAPITIAATFGQIRNSYNHF